MEARVVMSHTRLDGWMDGGGGVRSATVLVGREAELDQLLRAVRGARAGQPSCTLVVGEGGIGKSRLLGEATAAARRLGLGVAAGRAPITGPAPFSIVAQALRSWSRGHPLTPTRSPFDQGLRLVLPEWETPDGLAADLTAAQLRLLALEGIGLVLRQIVQAGHGALLVLDDLHAADPESLEVIRYVSAAAVDGLAIVGALRSGESPLADELVRTVRTDVAAAVIELDPLGRRAVGELVTSLLGAAAPDELVADVAARTDGVPFLVEEVVDAHVRAGSVDMTGGAARWRAAGPCWCPGRFAAWWRRGSSPCPARSGRYSWPERCWASSTPPGCSPRWPAATNRPSMTPCPGARRPACWRPGRA